MRRLARSWLFVTILLCLSGSVPAQISAEVHVNIGVFAPPPPLVMAGPPLMAVVPGTAYVYFVPDATIDIFYYRGYWYRPHESRWFRARSYRGPWNHIDRTLLSPVLVNLPLDYRNVPPDHRGIPYGQVRTNWKHWEKEHHWDKRGKRHDSINRPQEPSKVTSNHGEQTSKAKGKRKD